MLDKLSCLFSDREKKQFIKIIILIVIGAALEVVSLISIIPFFSLLAQDTSYKVNEVVLSVAPEYSDLSRVELIFAIGLLVSVLFIVKNLYLLLINYKAHKFIYEKYTNISTALLEKYINMPYLDHTQNSSSILQRNINTDVFWLVANILVPSVTFLTEVVITIAIMVSLIYIEPLSIILMVIFGILTVLMMKIVKSRVGNLGSISQSYFGEMVRSVDQSLGGIKLTKVSSSEEYFIKNYRQNITQYANNTALLKNISQWPRYFVETILIVGVVLVSIFISSGASLAENLPVIAFFGMAIVRLMPSFNRIISAYTNIRYYSASLDTVYKEINKSKSSEGFPDSASNNYVLTFNSILEFKNVDFIYPGAPSHAVSSLNIKIKYGETVAFVGTSGSGKTTIIDLICGLIEPTKGTICVDNVNIHNNLTYWKSFIGYVPQVVYLLDDSIRNNIAYGHDIETIDDTKIKYALHFSQLDNYVSELEFGLDTNIGENGIKMSGGQRQRLGIARALYNSPKVLILDESTAALDNKTQRDLTESIQLLSKEVTVIIVAHRLSIVEGCDHIFVIDKGMLVDDILDNSQRNKKLKELQLLD